LQRLLWQAEPLGLLRERESWLLLVWLQELRGFGGQLIERKEQREPKGSLKSREKQEVCS